MIITIDDSRGTYDLKHFLNQLFEIKDLDSLNYFLGHEVSTYDNGLYLSQVKYTSNLLARAKLTNNKIVNTPIY